METPWLRRGVSGLGVVAAAVATFGPIGCGQGGDPHERLQVIARLAQTTHQRSDRVPRVVHVDVGYGIDAAESGEASHTAVVSVHQVLEDDDYRKVRYHFAFVDGKWIYEGQSDYDAVIQGEPDVMNPGVIDNWLDAYKPRDAADHYHLFSEHESIKAGASAD